MIALLAALACDPVGYAAAAFRLPDCWRYYKGLVREFAEHRVG